MAIIKELNPGDTLKVYEDGVAAEFVVAQHNYEKDLNGKGKTMLMRTTLLKDAVKWGNNKKDVSWKNEPTLRNWLENTYAARLSEDTLKTIVPVTIRYDYGSSESGTLEEQRFFVPRVVDFSGDTALFTGIRRFFEDSLSGGRADITEGSNIYDLWTYVFSTRSTKNYEDGDNTRGEALSLYVKHGRGADPGSPGYINTYWDTTTGQWGVSSPNILVCFCVDENATVDDNGCLTANSGPEIQSNYGWYKRGWLFWETTNPISREAYNGESIKKYGLCQRVLVVEGTDSTGDSLLKKATDELKKYSGFTGSVQINAADLCDIGVDTDRLDFMKETYVLAEPHSIDDWLPCTKEVIPLHELDQKDFTFGATTAKLSSLQAGNFATAGKAWNAIQSTIGYINK